MFVQSIVRSFDRWIFRSFCFVCLPACLRWHGCRRWCWYWCCCKGTGCTAINVAEDAPEPHGGCVLRRCKPGARPSRAMEGFDAYAYVPAAAPTGAPTGAHADTYLNTYVTLADAVPNKAPAPLSASSSVSSSASAQSAQSAQSARSAQSAQSACNSGDVLASTYSVYGKRALIAVASWCACSTTAATTGLLKIDWAGLGMRPEATNATIPEVPTLQSFKQLDATTLAKVPIVMQGAKGGLLLELHAT